MTSRKSKRKSSLIVYLATWEEGWWAPEEETHLVGNRYNLLFIFYLLVIIPIFSGLHLNYLTHSFLIYFEGVEGGFAADEEAEKYEYVDSYSLFVQPTNEFIPLPNASLPAKVRKSSDKHKHNHKQHHFMLLLAPFTPHLLPFTLQYAINIYHLFIYLFIYTFSFYTPFTPIYTTICRFSRAWRRLSKLKPPRKKTKLPRGSRPSSCKLANTLPISSSLIMEWKYLPLDGSALRYMIERMCVRMFSVFVKWVASHQLQVSKHAANLKQITA